MTAYTIFLIYLNIYAKVIVKDVWIVHSELNVDVYVQWLFHRVASVPDTLFCWQLIIRALAWNSSRLTCHSHYTHWACNRCGCFSNSLKSSLEHILLHSIHPYLSLSIYCIHQSIISACAQWGGCSLDILQNHLIQKYFSWIHIFYLIMLHV